MGVLANHVPSIEQLKPGLVEVIEEAGGSKQFFCMYNSTREDFREGMESFVQKTKHKSAKEGWMRIKRETILTDVNSVRRLRDSATGLSTEHQRC